MSRVFSIEPEGITRAWPMVPLISKKTSATQNQAMTSRCTRCPTGTFDSASFVLRLASAFRSAFMFHRHRMLVRAFTIINHRFTFFAARNIVAHFQLHQVGRIHSGVAGGAVTVLCVVHRPLQSAQRNVAQRVGPDIFANFLWRVRRCDQLFSRWRIDAVIARRNRRRATDAHVNFSRARFPYHTHDFAASGAAHKGIVHQHYALAFDEAAHRIELQLHAKIADGLRRLDKRPANIMIADQAHTERNAGLQRETHCRGHSGVGHRHDNVRPYRMLFRQRAAQRFAAGGDRAAEDDAVWPREIYMLENALLPRLFRREVNGLDAGARNAHHFAGFDLTDVLRVEQIESAGFRGHQPGIAQLAETQRAKAARIADGNQLIGSEHEQRICAFHLVQGIAQRTGEIARLRACQQMHDHFRVAIGLKYRAFVLQFAAPVRGVGEIAVVPKRHFALVAVDHDRLRVQQSLVTCGGIARVADSEIAGQIREHWRGKDFFHFTHRAMQMQLRAIAGDDSSRFLAAMLQRVQAKIGQLGSLFMSEHAEYTTFVVKMVVGVSELLHHLHLIPRDQLTLRVRSSEWAQTSYSLATDVSITALSLYSMRKASLPMTWPIWCAVTPYCRAVSRTAASEVGATETMARAPLSPKRAYSAGNVVPSSLTFAPSWGAACCAPTGSAKQDSANVTAMPPSLMSCAERTAPFAASATRHSCRRFSPARSIAGGSPATIPLIVLEYSLDENSRRASSRGAACCAPDTRTAPSSKTIRSPSSRKPIFRTREASSRIPSTPITGVG